MTAAPSALRIAAIRLLCRDPAGTADFYTAAFGCRSRERPLTLRLGEQRVELAHASAPAGEPAVANATGFQHLAIVVTDMAEATRRLDAVLGWTAISRAGPERLPEASGGVTAFKFRDPEGHPLEFLAFPAGRAASAWRDQPGLFLGIDHTAITAAETGRSVAFYEGLGFTVASRGVNTGPEQARLDGLEDPEVEVTGLVPPGGAPPHLELLCYRAPRVLDRPAADGGPLATETVFSGALLAGRPRADPDGHRLVWPG